MQLDYYTRKFRIAENILSSILPFIEIWSKKTDNRPFRFSLLHRRWSAGYRWLSTNSLVVGVAIICGRVSLPWNDKNISYRRSLFTVEVFEFLYSATLLEEFCSGLILKHNT